jgi:hypothetical protein
VDDFPVVVGVDDLGDGSDREGLTGPRSERRAWKTYCLARHGSSAHSYLARQLSTKDARQSTEGFTHDGRVIIEVSEIRSEMMTRHKI